MEGLKLTEYEASESETGHNLTHDAETSSGMVKHNGGMGLSRDSLASEQAAAQPSAIMANDQSTSVATNSREAAVLSTGHELDAFLGKAFEEKPVWAGLWESIHDVFFPVKLPPLELTSKPIPVPDRMAVKANPWAIGSAGAVNLAILLILLFFVGRKILETPKPAVAVTPIDVSDFNLKAPRAATAAGGGGGGGSHDIIDPIKGHLPPRMKDPITPPQVPVLDKPKLAIQSAIDVQPNITLPDNPTLPNIGVKSSANVTLASNGSGSNGMGTGSGGGLGSGNGDGYGPGTGGNTGGGLERIGGGVSAPVALNNVEAEFSDEARRAKYQGVCLIQ